MDGGGAALRAARVGVAGAFGVRRAAASVAVGCGCGCGWSGSGGMLNACSNACVGGTTPLNLAVNLAVPAAIVGGIEIDEIERLISESISESIRVNLVNLVGGIERLVYMCDVVECRRGD